MKEYGHFDDSSREFVITDPATPWPWINYLGTEDFFSLISGTAGGYCFCRDAKFRRITRYRYNGVPADAGGRYFYIREGGRVWNPGWKPCKTALDSYECRHGMGYTRISSSLDGLEASVLFFVPPGRRCEVQKVTLHNSSPVRRNFQFYSFVEWCLWNAASDMENFQRNLSVGEVEVEGSVIYHKTEYRERRNHFAFYGVNAPIDGFDTDRESFLGMYNGFEAPDCVMQGVSRDSVAHGWSPIASHRIDITLEPGGSRELVFVLGYVENAAEEKFEWQCGCTRPEVVAVHNSCSELINKRGAYELLREFDSVAKADAAFEALGRYWDGLLGGFQLHSDKPELDRMVNVWNQYQCMVTFNMSRSASFFESGIGRGMGFRDSNQDLVGFVHQIPERARERIIDIASTQFSDGACYHQYQPLTKRGNDDIGAGFGDDPLWLIFGTVAYIRETGDFGILDEMVPFDNEPGSERSLLEHLFVSFAFVTDRTGPHGLPLIGRADWNDCLNLNCFSLDPDESFQTTENKTECSKAESLMIAGQYVFCGRQFAGLLRSLGREADAQRIEALADAMSSRVECYGWDGEWFLRAYDYSGGKVGSAECSEGKIFIESQGWCTMARIGQGRGYCDKSLDSVKALLDCEHGIVLNNPAFSRYLYEYGEISSYPQGYKENAGIFCHNNPWIVIGEAEAGRADDAWEHYRKICPAYITDQHLHRVEPYVYCQMVAGKDSARPGEGKNSWLTGTAAWNWYALTEWILGVRPDYEGLRIRPCVPSSWTGYSILRRFRGAEYDIRFVRDGRTGIILDGRRLEGDLVPYSPGKHKVEVFL